MTYDRDGQRHNRMTTLVQAEAGRVIGSVESVSPVRIVVGLRDDAPQATALNTGTPEGFPRINAYLVIPGTSGSVVGMVSSVEITKEPAIRRRDRGGEFVGLPYPRRVVRLTPIGTLVRDDDPHCTLRVRRGVDVFPSVGDAVLLPSREELCAVVEGDGSEETSRILVGRSPTAGWAPVHVSPNNLFARHLAVLGNTGSGKSCSVAGLVRWSLESARAHVQDGTTNARFIVIDPNGEYSEAFRDLGARVVHAGGGESGNVIRIPAWLWNTEEWAAFTRAAPGVQRPVLGRAIEMLRSAGGSLRGWEAEVARVVGPNLAVLRDAHMRRSYLEFPGTKAVTCVLSSIGEAMGRLAKEVGDSGGKLGDRIVVAKNLCSDAESAGRDGQYFRPIPEEKVRAVIETLQGIRDDVGFEDGHRVADVPIPFSVSALPEMLETVAALTGGKDTVTHVGTLVERVRNLLNREQLARVLGLLDSGGITLDEVISEYLGSGDDERIVVVDLSLMPSDVVHTVVAVFSRLILESLQRYRRAVGGPLPTVLVVDEAHSFIHRRQLREEAGPAEVLCARAMERIAREGRKFGLGLVVATQRPAEVSPTVLSQCNTFLLHRLVNERDQEVVRGLVPEALGEMLGDIASLPTRRAIVLGWAVPAPVLVEMRELPQEARPKAADPNYWEAWTTRGARPGVWSEIAGEWQGGRREKGDDE